MAQHVILKEPRLQQHLLDLQVERSRNVISAGPRSAFERSCRVLVMSHQRSWTSAVLLRKKRTCLRPSSHFAESRDVDASYTYLILLISAAFWDWVGFYGALNITLLTPFKSDIRTATFFFLCICCQPLTGCPLGIVITDLGL